ncbi:MAG: hypothetical protein R6X02_30585 [Enhygromyxa sp.]
MSRPRSTLLAATLAAATLWACEKDRPAAEQPGPTVIVEDPGVAPAGETGDDEPPTAAGPEAPEFGSIEVVATDVPCQSDAECVKDSCCHASSCVAIADAPDCSAAVCTLECRGGTMDCYGGCVCQAGRCAARLWIAPPD